MDREALDMAIAKILAALLVKETRAELQNAAQSRTDRAAVPRADSETTFPPHAA